MISASASAFFIVSSKSAFAFSSASFISLSYSEFINCSFSESSASFCFKSSSFSESSLLAISSGVSEGSNTTSVISSATNSLKTLSPSASSAGISFCFITTVLSIATGSGSYPKLRLVDLITLSNNLVFLSALAYNKFALVFEFSYDRYDSCLNFFNITHTNVMQIFDF